MSSGLFGLILVLLVVVIAISTRQVEVSLILASMIGCIYLYQGDFITQWCSILQQALENNAWVMLLVGIFGSFIALLQASNGHLGFSKIIDRICNTEKKTLLTTFVLGCVIFIDEFLNVLSIGACMKDHYDKQKIPREALAYLLDSTGTPVCVLIPVSGWGVCFISMFEKEDSFRALGNDSIANYMKAVPFCFYAIFTIIILILFCLGIMPKLGGMKKAYERVATTGEVYSEKSRKYNQKINTNTQEGNALDFLIPMGVLVAMTAVTGDLIPALIVAIIVCAIMYLPRHRINVTDFFPTIVKGFASMLPVLTILLLTYHLQIVTEKLNLVDYVITITEPYLKGAWFPTIVFLLVAALCFTTASFVGTAAIVTPLVFPLGAAIGANTVLVMAAIISGCAFGSHACFYADATIVASNSAGIDNMEHAISQFPYVIIATVLSIICFTISGFVLT